MKKTILLLVLGLSFAISGITQDNSKESEDGSRFVMAISRPPAEKFKAGMTFAFTGTIWHADGKIHYVTRKFTCVDADSWHSSTIGTDQDGNAIPKVITTAKRTK